MNAAKSNYLIEISEVEITASIELTAPLFMLMILVSAMTTVNTQKIRGACVDNILGIVLSRPITFMKLVSESGCAAETVEKYVKTHINNNLIYQKKANLEFFILQI